MDVHIQNLQRALRVDPARMGRLARCAIRRLRVRRAGTILVTFIDTRRIRVLNRRFRRHDWTTDVLSFRYDGGQAVPSAGRVVPRLALLARDDPERGPTVKGRSPSRGIVGEILIAPSCARAYALAHGIPYTQELSRYVVHGLLHWLGREDRTKAQQAAMRAAEDRLLAHCMRWK